MSRADVAARAITAELNPSDLPIDPEDIARNLGVMVVKESGTPGLSGMLLRRDGRIAMGINPDRPLPAQRLALAHLIGHFQMHAQRDLILDTVARHTYGHLPSMPTDREEAEANRFAAALLAPDGLVREAVAGARFETAVELVDQLASRFGMTPAAMGYRLLGLGVVADI